MPLTGISRELMAVRLAKELRPGMTVNLGIGLPTLVANYVPPGCGVTFQAENGILGYGPTPADAGDYDEDFINAGGQPITLVPGACFFDSAQSFAMIRGGHIDAAILGGLQVSAAGDLANWMVPKRGGGSIGGAMDLAVGARRLLVGMEHRTRDGSPRILEMCTYPLTARRCVDLIVTDLAVIEVTARGLRLVERAPGVPVEAIVEATGARLAATGEIPEMSFDLPF